MSLKVDCHELEVTNNLELLASFGKNLEGVCHELDTQYDYKLISNLNGAFYDQTFLEKASS
jgi:hypothetical protein